MGACCSSPKKEDRASLVKQDAQSSRARAASLRKAADEEAQPFAAGSFDLVTSVLSLHWVNDLPAQHGHDGVALHNGIANKQHSVCLSFREASYPFPIWIGDLHSTHVW